MAEANQAILKELDQKPLPARINPLELQTWPLEELKAAEEEFASSMSLKQGYLENNTPVGVRKAC